MSRRRHTEHEEEHENHERWLVTYADMITLLMVLFIVLFAISQVDQKKFAALKDGLSQGLGSTTNVVVSGGTSINQTDGVAPAAINIGGAGASRPATQGDHVERAPQGGEATGEPGGIDDRRILRCAVDALLGQPDQPHGERRRRLGGAVDRVGQDADGEAIDGIEPGVGDEAGEPAAVASHQAAFCSGIEPGGSRLVSRSATTRGLVPDWMASTPSSATSICWHSTSDSRLSRLAIGSQSTLAESTPQSVATKAPAMR